MKTTLRQAVKMARSLDRAVFISHSHDLADSEFDAFFALPHDLRLSEFKLFGI